MKVLITGDRGFIGRHLRATLEARSDHVTGCDLLDGRDALDLFRGDTTRYDLAVHCAATIGGRAGIDGSPLAVATNLALDAWYMRWLVRSGTPRAVYYSSSAAYPVDLQTGGIALPLAEDDIDLTRPRLPDATYGLVKLTGEQLVPYAEAAGCRVHVLRPFSGYGEDQADCYPFPAFIARARRRANPFTIWGTGRQVRDWIHVDDIVDATLAAVDQDVDGPVNLGWGRATTFDELATLVTDRAGYHAALDHRLDAPDGVQYRVCDPGQLLSFYRPTIELEDGIRRALHG